ncbi:hypothetical protein [Francisella tularensis]|uniref:hypothetical protein n=1 Tax=Francisella tularensis TaxID=263 RepID=UPI0005B63B07|nr:hypothetical protein [Francisella tularensis]
MKNMKLKKSTKILGSSLVSVMIFSFVVLVTVSSLVYVVRFNLLGIKSLNQQEAVITAEQQYIHNIFAKNSIKLGKNNIGDYDFDNVLKSSLAIFSNTNVDVSLYNAQPTAISNNIIHRLFYKGNLKLTKDIIYKDLPKHSMINYNSEFIPINIPYIDITRMNSSEQFYRLNQEQQISDNQHGFIGVIEKEYDWILISLNDGKTQVISLSGLNIAGDYKINIGWQLSQGRWQLLLAIYDNQHLYIFKTALNDLINNFDKAILDLSTPIDIIDPPKDIVTLSWYYQHDNSQPSLAVLTKRNDSAGNTSIIVEDIEYNSFNNTYKTSIKDAINGLGKLGDNNIYVEAVDPSYTLAKSPLYVFVGDKLIVYNLANSNKNDTLIVPLQNIVKHKPIIVKKDFYEYYILTYSGDRYYQYKYTSNTNIINLANTVIYPEQKIENIVVRYGLKFIITNKNIYIDDFTNKQLSEIAT